MRTEIVSEVNAVWQFLLVFLGEIQSVGHSAPQRPGPASVLADLCHVDRLGRTGLKELFFLWWFKLNCSNAGPECKGNLGVADQVLCGHWEPSELGASALSRGARHQGGDSLPE